MKNNDLFFTEVLHSVERFLHSTVLFWEDSPLLRGWARLALRVRSLAGSEIRTIKGEYSVFPNPTKAVGTEEGAAVRRQTTQQ